MQNKNNNFNRIDLLKNRREQGGIETNFFARKRELIAKGSYIGGIIMSIVLLITGALYSRKIGYENQKKEISAFVVEYNNLQNELNDKSSQMKKIASFNKKLASNIRKIISSSAFLTEISNIIPTNIELSLLTIQSNFVEFKGSVKEQNGLELVNLFALNISDSIFFDNEVFIQNIERNNTSISSEESAELKFTIRASVNSELQTLDSETLIRLGSLGNANRVEYLDKLGLTI
ncbi:MULTISPECIES: hypothetical protein [Prochlorococcus]|uniref:hypothetical protein n=1 Tax=Prochlorococcus TaxID=1218 RepID=UPI000533B58E|nr:MULTISPECIES: hypothetical protein [Prochlorococcus]KGG12526.1 hypothetical protein EV05_1738 [Prochlorococcus sp. MIT 0601]